MDSSFSVKKRAFLVAAVVKSAAVGLAAALAAVGILLLAFKLAAAVASPLWYVLAALAAFIVAGGITFLVLHPTDKNVARTLDEENSLRERVQTSLEFDGKEGAVLSLQREDAAARVEKLPSGRLNFGRIWQYAVALVVALALCVTGIAVPAAAQPVQPDPDAAPFTYTTYQQVGLSELITNVLASEVPDAAKSSAVTTLTELDGTLRSAKTVGEMRVAVTSAYGDVSAVMLGSTNYRTVALALDALHMARLASATATGAIAYRRTAVSSYDDVRRFRESTGLTEVNNAVIGQVDGMREELNAAGDALSEALTSTATGIEGALLGTGLDETDALFASLDRLAVALSDVETQRAGGAGEELVYSMVNLAIDDFGNFFCAALADQSYCLLVGRFVTVRLCTLFGLAIPDFDKNEVPVLSQPLPDDATDPDPDDQQGSGGGYGDGETEFGSDDYIYDPDTGEFVRYGDLLARYYAIVTERLRNGEIDEEQAKTAQDYFDILFGASDLEE